MPALVEPETWDRAQAQLARNAALSFRQQHQAQLSAALPADLRDLRPGHVRPHPPGDREPSRSGATTNATARTASVSARTAACPSRNIKAEEIEPAVWDHVAGLLADPRSAAGAVRPPCRHGGGWLCPGPRRRAAAPRSRLDRTARADKRLLDAYQAGAISLAELSERRHQLAGERRGLERQQQERDRLRQQRMQAEAVRTNLAAFCERIRTPPATRRRSPTSRRSCSWSSSASSSATAGWRSVMSFHCHPDRQAAAGRPPLMRHCVRMVCTLQR